MSAKDYNNQYLTVEDVAELMKVSTKTVYYWCSTGYLPSVKFGRLVRINKNDFNARIHELKKASRTKVRKHFPYSY